MYKFLAQDQHGPCKLLSGSCAGRTRSCPGAGLTKSLLMSQTRHVQGVGELAAALLEAAALTTTVVPALDLLRQRVEQSREQKRVCSKLSASSRPSPFRCIMRCLWDGLGMLVMQGNMRNAPGVATVPAWFGRRHAQACRRSPQVRGTEACLVLP